MDVQRGGQRPVLPLAAAEGVSYAATMRETLTFLHTAAVHVDTFNRLCVEMAPEIPLRHVVDGSLLDAARAAGTVTAALWVRVGEVIAEAERRARVVRFVDRPGRPRSPRRRPTVGC